MLNPERSDLPGASSSSLQAAAEIVEALMALPAVPSADWGDRAAACLTRVVRSGVVLALIAQIEETGRIASTEAVGIAAGHHGRERARGVTKGSPRLVRGPTGEEAALDALRARADKLVSIGWTPETLGGPSAAILGSTPGGRNWRNGPAGRLWGDLAPADLLVGLVPVGDYQRGRIAAIHIAPTGPSLPEPEDAAVLRAALPILARRACLAIGPIRSGPGQWLTGREQAVFDRLVIGRSVKQIAEELGRSTHTVHDHIKNLHRKLGARNRGELLARALGPAPDERSARLDRADSGSDAVGDRRLIHPLARSA